MKKHFGKLAAIVAATAIVPVVGIGISSPASAACTTAGKWTHYNLADSAKFDASSGCDGVWGVRAAQQDDPIRGRFYKDGAWQVSAYGWTFIYTANDNDVPKIIGNTINQRDIKGQGMTYGQVIYYQY